MKRASLILCLTFSTYFANSAKNDPLLKYRAFIMMEYIDKDGLNTFGSGGGFFVNNSYFVTCYHVYHPSDGIRKIKRITAFYNLKYLNGEKTPYADTVSLTVDYPTTPGQYDFRKHVYVQGDYTTDILVLKTIRNVRVNNLPINVSQSHLFDTLNCMGSELINHNYVYFDAKMTVIKPFFVVSHPDCLFLAFIGNARKGTSGSPALDKLGNIVGIIQGGLPVKNKADLLRQLNELHVKNIAHDMALYKPGYRAGHCISIQYVIDKYLRGYLP